MQSQADLHSDVTFFASPSTAAAMVQKLSLSHSLVLQGTIQRRITIGQQALTIGRLPPSDVVLSDSRVSRAHCRVELLDGQVVVTDLQSTNGTFLDGRRITDRTPLQHGAMLKIGSHVLLYERRTRQEVEDAAALDHDLQNASRYIQSMLPAPIGDGPVRTEWLFLPCAQLGGSGFGTSFVTPTKFATFMVSVVGYGTTAAMQSVAVMSLLRQREPPGADLQNPRALITGLNAMATGSTRDPSYALWYGVFDIETRRLEYASAGHFPGLLVGPDRVPVPLDTSCPVIGVLPDHIFGSGSVDVPPNTSIYLLSDGVADLIAQQDDADVVMGLSRLVGDAAQPDVPEPLRLYRAVRDRCDSQELDEDFVALITTFP